jgi:dipeptidyl-peptidase-4
MKKLIYILLLFISFQTSAQQSDLTLEDAVLGYYKGLYPKSLRNLQWVENTHNFLQREGNEIVIKNADNKIVKTITLDDYKTVFPDEGRLPYIEVSTADFLMFSKENSKILYYYNDAKFDKIDYPENADNLDFNTQKKALAYTVDNNLLISTVDENKVEVAINNDPNIVSGQAIARSEFGITKGTFWSPKGNKLAFYQKDETAVENYPLVDITVTPAKLKNIKYPMNGRGSEKPAVGVYDLASKKTIYLDLFEGAGANHYATNLSWGPNEEYVYLAEINRDQDHFWFNKYDARTGKFIKTLFEEKNEKWAEPEHPAFFIPNRKGEFIWLSERDGFMNLYKYNTKGKLIKQLTDFKWVVKNVEGFSKDGKYVFVSGTGADPRENHLFKIDTRRGKYVDITPKSGVHYLMLNSDNTHYLDYFSNIDTPRIIFLGTTDGKKKTELLNAENPLKAYNLPKPELGTIEGEMGATLYTRMFKPYNFDASKKYPVLIYVYGGPHAQMVTNRWNAGGSLWMNWLANQGYIVFTVDGHGSASRGFAFESVIHRQVGVVEMKDQLKGVAYLKSLPYVDENRIAVHGWSFGGFMTTSLMTTYPDVFKVGVAGGPVIDWKWYEVMYGERYMDTEAQNPDGFKNNRVQDKIKNLKGKLLTIHGYQDDVVVPQHNLALQRAAVKAGVQIDFYFYPTHPHNVRGKDRAHLMRKVLDYIMQYNK